MQSAFRSKRGSAAVFVVVALVVLGLAAVLYFNSQYQSRQRMIAYEREKVELARQEAEEKAAKAAREKAEAEEAAAREKAEADAAAKKAEAAKVVAERAKAEKVEKVKQLRFEDAEQAFIGAEVAMWTKGDDSAESVWCMLPYEDGTGRFFEIVPAKGDNPRLVRVLNAEGAVETMSPELFATRNFDDDTSWFVLRDGKALLRTKKPVQPSDGADEKISVPEEGSSYDIAEKIYGAAAKAVRVYKMRPPPIKWHVAFVSRGGRTLPVGKVAFGEKVTRDLFRPAVTKALEGVAAKMSLPQPASPSASAEKGAVVPSSFTPSKKRTHFLYDKGKIKRTVDGLVYVPRVFKAAKKEFSRNKRQQEQDEERQAQHKAEWQALYDEALRQEKAEAAERAAWERARGRGTAAARPKPQQQQQKVEVTPAHVERALDDGAFIYSPADD